MERGKGALEDMGLTSWKNHQVLVTGATGLLGSWMVEELLERGANVICLIRDWVPRSRLATSALMDRVIVIRGELQDYELLLRAINEYEIDTVFHLAAQTIVGTASRSPLSTFESNVRGTWTLLEACRVCPRLIERVIVASSDKAYGSHDKLPYTEETPLAGRYPYDVSKTCADLIAFSFFHTYRVPVSVTRCGNLYGGGDLNFNRLIPGTIRSALADEAPIIRSDGKFVRDYYYVKDAVAAYLELAEHLPDERLVGQAFNFGTETPMSVLEMVRTILTTMGKEWLSPVVLNEANHEIPEQYLCCAKARELLGWQPKYSVTQGLEETVDWYAAYVREDPVRELSLAL